ncbi:ABC transporter ATP-binding protein [Pandoraea sputorum]|uniref:sn-glycerol-3-phosphate import ATP-binding protein UgpC n=1 Tax=Pandoraea sputorum TaxID=93222 RepID=A0A239ST62_9BURK|nr:ABC transporter ATP-binding protein [Pandoraea sputorum]AJC18304.1 Fe3+/spermidine/putrescine ABC transporter ATP-binding protein [Pandoraea sputorum]MCE4062064.1 ABC transporter ATP-binding protein [Pandoraea sputorum]SNU88028.1 sn-glycerol-3-phosphate import ATP-binding protein UgpC [Pandoraea sputorum]VVE52562.1 Fe3+/spermidine/putrescine ABC transporter ATP-binding protein [Pandoraea sputorum]VVE83418.1 Fe3+/spermidine/putrescine ABC transporter ATP-binding protein [Pandoraea sputorum]
MANVSLRSLRKQYGNAAAVADFSLDIAEGELVAFLGPSGCGKTTTLRMVAGFVEPTAGEIWIGGKEVSRLPPHRRNTGMVFQRYALFPHMTVAENVAFGLEMRRVSAADRATRIREALDMVRLTSLADRYPRQLSGGQQQRVAIARALAIRPDVFLLDEPLSNLDAKLRTEVREEIRALQRRLGLTTIFVTHDQEEALAIADRLAVMHDGCVQQIGTADALYERPANPFVANFLGKMNFLAGQMDAGQFVTAKGERLALAGATPDAKTLGIRPERLRLTDAPAQHETALPVTVDQTIYLGSTLELRLKSPQGEMLVAHVPNTARDDARLYAPGSALKACFASTDCLFFNA